MTLHNILLMYSIAHYNIKKGLNSPLSESPSGGPLSSDALAEL